MSAPGPSPRAARRRSWARFALVSLWAIASACWGSSGTPPAPPEPAHDPGAPSGGEPDSYSAVVVRTFEGPGGRHEMEVRVARHGDRARQEWVEGGRRLALIVRPDLGRSFLVDVDAGAYVERSGEEAPGPEGAVLSGEEIEGLVAGEGTGVAVSRERAGVETVAGHPCAVYRSRIEAPSGGVSESTVWEAEDLGGLALKSELRGGDGSRVVTELRDVKVPADAALFDPPPGARRVETLGGR